ncbi:hypothetical protein PG985_004313 [Apiospora marii]|uniref:uncharacterized protein n=1 Tax=Apiospora marii TaxID=335849 RepID=UPI00312D9725
MSEWMGYMQTATPESSGTDQTAQNNFMPVNNQQQQAAEKTQPQAAPPGRRRGPGIIGRGLLPLSDGLSIQEYERRRKHNSEKAEENKKVQRERNNEAARRSRQRRADLISTQSGQIQRLSQEVGALTRERDYWKGVVERMQSGGGGMNGRGQQNDQPLPQHQQQQHQQQQTLTSQYLAYPSAMTPSVSVNSTPLSHIARTPSAQVPTQQQNPQFPAIATPSHLSANIAPSQLMHPFPDIAAASAQAQAQGVAMAAVPVKSNLNSPPVPQTFAPAAFDAAASGHADTGFAGYPFFPSADTPDNTSASDAVEGLDDSEFFQQMDEYNTHVKSGESVDAMEDFDFSISGN